MDRLMMKQNDAQKELIAKQVRDLKGVTTAIRDHLKREEVMINDVSSNFTKNQDLMEQATKRITDLLQSSAGRTVCYLMLAVLFLLFLLYLLK
jgi:predicted PurR-regulated permease PerM